MTVDLDAIRRRAANVANWAQSDSVHRLAHRDVPALIAEIERLQRELIDAVHVSGDVAA